MTGAGPHRPRPPRSGTDTRQTRRPGARDTIIRPPRHPDGPRPAPNDDGPRRGPWLQLLAVGALVIVAGVIGVILHSVLATDHHRPGRPRSAAAAPRARLQSRAPLSARTAHVRAGPIRALSAAGMPGGPVPSGFTPTSFTAVNAARWWLLGTAPCGSPPCTSVLRTDDGGRRFVGIPAPRTDTVSELRFADARDGFAFDPSLWTTHDDGATWHHVSLPGTVSDVETSGGYAYAVVRAAAGPGVLMRSPIGADAWRAVPAAGAVSGGLWAEGHDVVLEATVGAGATPRLLVSANAGETFAAHPVPPSVACQFALATAALWAHCSTGMLGGIWRASGPPGSAPLERIAASGLPPQPASAPFAAATGTVAVTGDQQLYRTADGGASWQRVRASTQVPAWRYLGFTDELHGVALGAAPGGRSLRLFHTSDGGASYQPVSFG